MFKFKLMKFFVFTLLTSSIFYGCSEEDTVKPTTTTEKAKLIVTHASPDAPGVDVRVDGNIAITNLAFPNNTSYLDITSGTRNLKVSPTGTQTYVIDANVSFTANTNYTLFAVDSVSKISTVLLTDDLTAPASGKSHVRFVHLSPNAPAVDVAVTGGPVLFQNYSFKQNSNFTPVDATTYNLEVRLAGTSTVVLSIPNVVLQNGKIYTVWAKGFVGGSGTQELGAQIILHN